MDRSPLHIAAERGHTTIVEMLVDKFKANVAARTKDGSTLMHISSQYGHPETALAFLKKGVPMLMPNKVGMQCIGTELACRRISMSMLMDREIGKEWFAPSLFAGEFHAMH